MELVVELLSRARQMYADAPSHAPYGHGCATGTYCPVLALEVATRTERSVFRDALCALADAAGVPRGPDVREDVIRWNAEAETSEVLSAFDKAIATKEVGDETGAS